MNPMFPKATKIIVPKAVEYPYSMGDDEFHPIDEKNHYTEVLQKIFGEQKGYEMAIVDVEITDVNIILSVIE